MGREPRSCASLGEVLRPPRMRTAIACCQALPTCRSQVLTVTATRRDPAPPSFSTLRCPPALPPSLPQPCAAAASRPPRGTATPSPSRRRGPPTCPSCWWAGGPRRAGTAHALQYSAHGFIWYLALHDLLGGFACRAPWSCARRLTSLLLPLPRRPLPQAYVTGGQRSSSASSIISLTGLDVLDMVGREGGWLSLVECFTGDPFRSGCRTTPTTPRGQRDSPPKAQKPATAKAWLRPGHHTMQPYAQAVKLHGQSNTVMAPGQQ